MKNVTSSATEYFIHTMKININKLTVIDKDTTGKKPFLKYELILDDHSKMISV